MRYLFLAIGLLFAIAGLVIVVVRPGMPSSTDLLAFQFILGGFVLLGIAHLAKLLQARSGS